MYTLWAVLFAVAVVLLLRPVIRNFPHGPGDAPPDDLDTTVAAQILFAERTPVDFQVDCVFLEPLEVWEVAIPSGFPVTLRLFLPDDDKLESAAENAILRWADEGHIVRLHFHKGNEGTRVRLMDESTTLQLDLEGATP